MASHTLGHILPHLALWASASLARKPAEQDGGWKGSLSHHPSTDTLVTVSTHPGVGRREPHLGNRAGCLQFMSPDPCLELPGPAALLNPLGKLPCLLLLLLHMLALRFLALPSASPPRRSISMVSSATTSSRKPLRIHSVLLFVGSAHSGDFSASLNHSFDSLFFFF